MGTDPVQDVQKVERATLQTIEEHSSDEDRAMASLSEELVAKASSTVSSARADSAVAVVGMQAPASIKQVPAFPFPADFSIEYCGSRIEVIQHLCQRHPLGTRAVAIFFPGVHGGVGPCRQPGFTFDNEALFPTVCQRLINSCPDIDCYRVSWPHMQPSMATAVAGGIRVLNHALMGSLRPTTTEANTDAQKSAPGKHKRRHRKELRTLKVIFIGHSLGGAVAFETASVVARHFCPDLASSRKLPAVLNVAGLCTLNAALMVESPMEMLTQTAFLGGVQKLMISGDHDEVVNPNATKTLFQAMPGPEKRHISLAGGTHGLYDHKDQLVDELVQFISHCCGEAA